MHQAASSRAYVLFAALTSLTAFGCGGGEDPADPPSMMPAGGAGGGTPGVMLATCEMGSAADPNVHDGYFADPAQGWEIAWFTYTDTIEAMKMSLAPGTITPAEKAPFVCVNDPTRNWVFNAKGGGFPVWGAGMGFNMKIGEPPGFVNLSAYKGVRFWAKVNSATTGSVRFKVVDQQTTPPDRGGTCSGMNGACDNSFGFEMTTISTDWKEFTITWDQLKQESWSSEMFGGVQTSNVIGFQFQVKKVEFDYSIDDFELLP